MGGDDQSLPIGVAVQDRELEDLGFDELVVYAPDSSAGLGSDPSVHEQALARLR